MQPREIDALIDETVFDRYVCRDRGDIPEGYNTEYVIQLPAYRDGTSVFDCREYSTDLAAAFTVGEKLWPDGWGVQKVRELVAGRDWVTHWEAGPITVEYHDRGGRTKQVIAYAEANTPAMAICLAALKCKGVEVD